VAAAERPLAAHAFSPLDADSEAELSIPTKMVESASRRPRPIGSPIADLATLPGRASHVANGYNL
jgi:hypothetical protein